MLCRAGGKRVSELGSVWRMAETTYSGNVIYLGSAVKAIENSANSWLKCLMCYISR